MWRGLVLNKRWISLQNVARKDSTKELRVTFDNGRTTSFPYVWLRDNAPHPSTTYRSNVGVGRTLLLADLDVDVKPKKVELNEAVCTSLKVTWPDIAEPVEYTAGWLADRDMWNKDVVERRKEMYLKTPTIWNSDLFAKSIRFFDFERVLTDDDHMSECLEFLSRWGLMFFDNAPKSGQLIRLSRKLGFHTCSHYGHTFEVKATPADSNLANTSAALGFHTDISWFSTPPDIQMLHCIVPAGDDSGHNIFVDGIHAARIMEDEAPQLYQSLCDCVVEFYDRGRDFGDFTVEFHNACSSKVFNFNHSGQLHRIKFSSHARTWFMDGTKYDVKLFYEALKYYNNILYRKENLFRLLLKGGIYFGWDVVRSTLRRIKCEKGEIDNF